jgi:hypothetical protein
MEQYIRGNLDSYRHSRIVKLFFFALLLSAFVSFSIYVAKARHNDLGSIMIKTEVKFLIGGIVLLAILFASYIKSMVQL